VAGATGLLDLEPVRSARPPPTWSDLLPRAGRLSPAVFLPLSDAAPRLRPGRRSLSTASPPWWTTVPGFSRCARRISRCARRTAPCPPGHVRLRHGTRGGGGALQGTGGARAIL